MFVLHVNWLVSSWRRLVEFDFIETTYKMDLEWTPFLKIQDYLVLSCSLWEYKSLIEAVRCKSVWTWLLACSWGEDKPHSVSPRSLRLKVSVLNSLWLTLGSKLQPRIRCSSAPPCPAHYKLKDDTPPRSMPERATWGTQYESLLELRFVAW